MEEKQVTTTLLKEKKEVGEKITMLTAYDYPMAKLVEEAGIDIILVGDSLGMVVLGYEDTLQVTIEDMIHHAQAVTRAANRSLVVVDLPFMAYKISQIGKTVENAGRIIKESRAQAVKVEGGAEVVAEIEAIIKAGIPVMGHLGLTPQAINQLGGFKIQGKEEAAAQNLIEDAKDLEKAGVFAIVLECIPSEVASRIRAEVTIPTIGIGAGEDCDGQVLVTQDLLGIYDNFTPKFVRKYANLNQEINLAFKKYKKDVEQGSFPSSEESF